MIRPASGFGRLFCKMRDELRNSRTVHNRLSSQLLYRVMDFRDWTELKLAEMSGILPSVVSAHLCGERPIRPQHLAAYLGVLDRQERVAFLDAWLRDNMITRRSRIYSTAPRLVRCHQSKRISVGCSIGGQRRLRTIPRSLKSSPVSAQKLGSSFLRCSCCL